MSRWPLPLAMVVLATWPAAAQDRPASEEIGSWLLTCPNNAAGSCELRHRSWVQPPGAGSPSAALEIVQRGGQLVPVVALRGLSTQVAVAGLLALQPGVALRFDGAPRTELTCELDAGAVVCVPPDTAAAANSLSGSHSVVVQMRLNLPGGTALPEQMRSLELSRTAEALARFRATAPANQSIPVVPGLDWRGLLDRLARDAGFPGGIGDLLPDLSTR